jgi:plasmid stabilization system protein ParE
MPSVVLHDDAERELHEAVDFFEAARPYYGTLFFEAYDQAIERLLRFPRAGRVIRGSLRRRVIPKWKYSIVYSIEPYGIYVVAVAHQSRRPGYWRNRQTR